MTAGLGGRTPSLQQVAADERELDRLAAGLTPATDDPALALLAAWRTELDDAAAALLGYGTPVPQAVPQPASPVAVREIRPARSLSRARSRVAVVVVASAATVVLGSGTTAAAWQSQPGDALFPIRSGVGAVIGRPHPVTVAEERLVQARRLLSTGRPEDVAAAVELAREADALLRDEPETEARSDLLAQVEAVDVQVAVLSPRETAPAAAPPAAETPATRAPTASPTGAPAPTASPTGAPAPSTTGGSGSGGGTPAPTTPAPSGSASPSPSSDPSVTPTPDPAATVPGKDTVSPTSEPTEGTGGSEAAPASPSGSSETSPTGAP